MHPYTTMHSYDTDTPTPRSRGSKIALGVGFLALFVAVVAAQLSPANDYQLSIYANTPLAFWAGIAAALLLSFGVAFTTRSRGIRGLAFLLGGAAIVLVAALPVLRGFYFYGSGDAMTHLGWTREIADGSLSMLSLLYPAIHTISVFVSDVTGLSLRRALMLIVPLFVAVFLLFVPLVVRAITSDDRAVLLAVFSAFLLIPVSHLGVNMTAHPTSQAVMFFPVLLFLVVMYTARRDTNSDLFSLVSPAGVLLGLTSIGIVLLHPQQTANVLLVYGTIVMVQFVYRLFRSDHSISGHRSMLGQTLFLGALFAVWVPRYDETSGALGGLLTDLLSGAGASALGQRGGALSDLGSGLEEIFLKLFLVAAIFSVLAAALALGSIFHRLDGRRANENSLLLYLSVAAIPVSAHFALFFAAGDSTMYFRHFGFLMVLVTVLGSIALYRGLGRLSGRVSGRTIRVGGAVALVLLLAISMPVMLRSPYIYQSSHQVTEAQMSGYETAFDHHAEEIYFSGVRSSGERFGDAIMGSSANEGVWWTEYSHRDYQTVPMDENFSADRFPALYEYDHYIPVTDKNRARELGLLDGFRYPSEGFTSLETNERVSRVQDTGGFELYLFDHPRSRR